MFYVYGPIHLSILRVKVQKLRSAFRYKLEFVDGSNPRATLDLPSSAIEKTFDSKPNTKWTVRIR